MINFPYQKDLLGNYYPLVTLALSHQNNILKTTFLLDSGANISIIRPELAKSLRINITRGREIELGGVGGRIKGYIHDLKFELAGKKFTAPVVFSNDYYVSFNLLGRSDVFKHFKILFDERKLLVNFS